MPAWLTGMVSGFNQQRDKIEEQNFKEAQLQRQREAAIYEALINSPDPDIRAHAITGLLDSAKPQSRQAGISGWLGKMQQNPALGRIRALIDQPVASQEPTYGLPSTQTSGVIGMPPGQTSSMAQSEASPTEAGSPPMPSIAPTIQPQLKTTQAAAPVTGSKTVLRPRQVFETPESLVLKKNRAEAQGDVEGKVAGLVAAGFTDVEARAIVKSQMERAARGIGASPFQSIPGEIVAADGTVTPAYGVFDRVAGHYKDPVSQLPLTNFRPRTTTGSRSLGTFYEIAAREKGFASGGMVPPDRVLEVETRAQELAQAQAKATGTGTGQARFEAPLTPTQAQQVGAPVGSTGPQLAGQTVPTAAEQTRSVAITNITNELDRIEQLISVLPSDTELGGRAPNVVMAVRRRMPETRAQVAALEAAIDGILASLARSVQENRGAQSEADAQRAYASIGAIKGSLSDPLGGDTQESVKARLAETRAALMRIQSLTPTRVQPTPQGQPGIGTAPPGAAPATPAAPKAYQDAQGNWRIR